MRVSGTNARPARSRRWVYAVSASMGEGGSFANATGPARRDRGAKRAIHRERGRGQRRMTRRCTARRENERLRTARTWQCKNERTREQTICESSTSQPAQEDMVGSCLRVLDFRRGRARRVGRLADTASVSSKRKCKKRSRAQEADRGLQTAVFSSAGRVCVSCSFVSGGKLSLGGDAGRRSWCSKVQNAR